MGTALISQRAMKGGGDEEGNVGKKKRLRERKRGGRSG